LFNDTKDRLLCRQEAGKEIFDLGPGESKPLWFEKAKVGHLVLFSNPDKLKDQWTVESLKVDQVGTYYIKIPHPNDPEQHCFFNVNIRESSIGIVIVHVTAPTLNPKIVNRTKFPLYVRQKEEHGLTLVPPHTITVFGYDNPHGSTEVDLILAGKEKNMVKRVDISSISSQVEYQGLEDYWVASAVIYKGRNINCVVNQVEGGKKPKKLDLYKEQEKKELNFVLGIRDLGISVINVRPEEIAFIRLEDIIIQYVGNDIHSTIECIIKNIQVSILLFRSFLTHFIRLIINYLSHHIQFSSGIRQ